MRRFFDIKTGTLYLCELDISDSKIPEEFIEVNERTENDESRVELRRQVCEPHQTFFSVKNHMIYEGGYYISKDINTDLIPVERTIIAYTDNLPG